MRALTLAPLPALCFWESCADLSLSLSLTLSLASAPLPAMCLYVSCAGISLSRARSLTFSLSSTPPPLPPPSLSCARPRGYNCFNNYNAFIICKRDPYPLSPLTR
jgi:hypothetical protein